MDEITINITLLDRSYRLSMSRADEERVKYYAKHYAYKDALDLMSMTALQFATSVIKLDAELTFKDQHLERKLNDLNDLLSEQS